MKNFWNDFATPGAEFRGAPFWAWNGKLEEQELRKQIRLFKRMGLGGFFMHARVGLGTPYLSDTFFDCVRACQDEAQKEGTLAYLYDEDRWPSGAAGGIVTKNPDFRQRRLLLFELKPDEAAQHMPQGKIHLIAAGKVDGRRLTGLRALPSLTEAVKPGESVLVFEERPMKCSTWYNFQSYLDTMNPEAVREFIRVTYARYEKEVGDTFKTVSPAIFTDEPNYGHVCESLNAANTEIEIPWTPALPEEFRKRFGSDLLPHLAEIFYDVEGTDAFPTRWRYMETITSLFVNSFSRQIGEWCAGHGIDFTGHALMEDTLSEQTRAIGSAMRFYEHMQIPGMDLLTEHWRVYDTAKQVASAARQFGRNRRLTETDGCTGWDFPFAGHKALGDWQLALGVNLRCPHLSYYTMAAEAKRDYPASIFYQSPWFAEYAAVEDYFARLTAVMTKGEEQREILVLHPIESMWGIIGKDFKKDAATRELDESLIALRDQLLENHLDFDYGDEELLSRHARVAGKRLHVGKASYRVVLVPSMHTMRGTTLALLQKFHAAGGVIAFAAPAPKRLDGFPSIAVQEFARHFSGDWLRAAEAGRVLRVSDAAGKMPAPILSSLRRGDTFDALFLCNTGHTQDQLRHGADDDPTRCVDRRAAFDHVLITFDSPLGGAAMELDAETGAVFAADAEYNAGRWTIRTSFPTLGSRLFVVQKKAPEKMPAPRPAALPARDTAALDKNWKIRRSEPNVLVIDHFRAAEADGAFGIPEYVIALDDRLRKAQNLEKRGSNMPQPWLQIPPSGHSVRLRLEAVFECSELPASPVELGIEFPALYHIRLNGLPVFTDDESGFYCDASLRKLPLPLHAFRKGENTLELETVFHDHHPGLEAVFLLGDFGVTKNTLTAPCTSLHAGDWVAQGLPYYGGNVIYSQRIASPTGRMRLRFGEWGGTALRVLVDGVPGKVIGWPPYVAELRDLPAEFELGIEVLGHRRNVLGPFYCGESWPTWTGPGSFKMYVSPEKNLVPCGLLENPILEVL